MSAPTERPPTAPPVPVAGSTEGHRAVTGAATGMAGSAILQVVAFLVAMVALVAVLWLLGFDPAAIVSALWEGSAGSAIAFETSLTQAVPIMLTATAVWLAFRAGLFNIGADGQLQIGGLCALLVLLALPESLPSLLLIAAGLGAAAIGGALWAAVAAVLKVRRGASEIISTLMLNFLAFALIDRLMSGPLRAEDALYTPQTEPVPVGAELPLGLAGTPLTTGIVLAVLVSVATVLLVLRTNPGLRMRAVGLNRDAARYAGVRISRYWMVSFAISGAICGFAGGIVLLELRFEIAPGWAQPWGLLGIIVAFLALRTPFLIPVWGVLFGMLTAAGPVLKGDASVPDAAVIVMQTFPVIVLFVLYAVGRRLSASGWQGAGRRRTPAR